MLVKARRRYAEEFKLEAVRLVREFAHPVAQVARDLGIPENVLYRWRTQQQQARPMARQGNCWDNACVESFFGTHVSVGSLCHGNTIAHQGW